MTTEDTTPTNIDLKELAFVESYLRTWSASAAYRETHPDCTPATSWTEGSQWLRKPGVQAILKTMLEEKSMSAEEVVEQLTRLGRQGSIRALALLAKVHGLLIDRVDAKIEHQMSWKDFLEGGNSDADPNSNS
jgi:hypothetical protein